MIDTALAALLALIASVALHTGARSAVTALRPPIAAGVLVGGSLLSTLALGLTMSAVGLAVAGRSAPIAALGEWSAPVLTLLVPVPAWLGVLAAIAALVLGGSALVRCLRIIVALTRADLVSRRLRSGGGPVVLLADDATDAYTIAGLHGCVVIGTSLLNQLCVTDRRALVAHELSHLNRRHHLYVHAADLAAAANPLLRNIPDTVRLAVERWADEDAVTALGGDRRAVARALARVARIRGHATRPAAAHQEPAARGTTGLAMAASYLSRRAAALLARPARARLPLLTLVGTAVAVAAIVTSSISAAQIQDRIEIAQQALTVVQHGPHHAAPPNERPGPDAPR